MRRRHSRRPRSKGRLAFVCDARYASKRRRFHATQTGNTRASGCLLACAVTARGQRATAQSGSADDARWYPWIGCWQRSGDTGASNQFTCVRPGGDGSADILTISNGAVESRERLVVDGLAHPIDTDGCRGSQTASWSTTDGGSRLYIGSAYSCAGGLRGRSTRMFAILPSGVWLEVRDVHAGGGWVETVTRFHDAGLPASIPASVRSEISHRGLIVATARAAASAPVSEADIAEATRSVDTAVVQSWLTARGEGAASDPTAARNAMANNSATSNVRIFYGTPPSQPQPPPQPEYEPGCDAYGCYPMNGYPNGYSAYNGYGYGYPMSINGYPYPYPYSPFYGPGVLGFGLGAFGPVTSAVVLRGGVARTTARTSGGWTSRRWTSEGARPGGVNPGGTQPGGPRPGGPRPGGARPGGARPGSPTPTPVSQHAGRTASVRTDVRFARR